MMRLKWYISNETQFYCHSPTTEKAEACFTEALVTIRGFKHLAGEVFDVIVLTVGN